MPLLLSRGQQFSQRSLTKHNNMDYISYRCFFPPFLHNIHRSTPHTRSFNRQSSRTQRHPLISTTASQRKQQNTHSWSARVIFHQPTAGKIRTGDVDDEARVHEYEPVHKSAATQTGLNNCGEKKTELSEFTRRTTDITPLRTIQEVWF